MIAGWKWKLALALAVVFLAGVAVGLFAGARHAHFVFIGRHGHNSERMRDHLARQLRLTPKQSDQIAPIVDGMATQLDVIRTETKHRVATTFERAHQQRMPWLTPEQRERPEELKREHRRMLRGNGPPPDEEP
ncbi:MAG: hypothetical protein ACR2HH_15675 [Chthoniobacterales bacterium]